MISGRWGGFNFILILNSFKKQGRYNKYSRTLSQTAWMIEGERKMISSIEETMGDILKRELGAKGCGFDIFFIFL
jgi:tRNA U54 and U55 pseudouridine synthase Pus10